MTVSSSAEFRRFSIFVPNEVAVGHTVSSSYLLDVSGSSKLGYDLSDRHQFTGSINQTGSGTTSHFMDKVGVGLRTPLNMALTISGSAVSYQGIAGPEYATGFAGYGYAWLTQSVDQKWHLMTDNLTVRGIMNIYELLIHQIRATNGSIWVSNSGKITSASLEADSTWTLFFDTGSDYGHTFMNGDIIRAQRWDAANNNLYQSDLRVILIESAEIVTASLNAGTTEPTGGMEYVRIGNEFTAESASRQGAIYLTSDDTEAPYIDVIDGITTHSDFNSAGTIKVRIGKLEGFSDDDYGTLAGYGMYATGSVYLHGGIIATYGKIGGWHIASSYISASDQNAIIDSSVPKFAFGTTANTMDINSGSSGVFISGSGEFRFGGATDDYLKLWGGTFSVKGTSIDFETENFHLSSSGLEISSSDSSINLRNLIIISGSTIPIIKVAGGIISASNFYVDQYGNLTASNAYVAGIISASAGNIGGWTINSTDLRSTNDNLMLSSSGVISASNFYIDAEGHLTASSAKIFGILSASVGNIGGWTINAENLKATSDKMMLSGSGVISSSNFYVDAEGHLTASSAKVFGILSASAGNIGGWTITSDKIGTPDAKYLSLNSASSSLYVYPELTDYTAVVRVGNFELSAMGSGTLAFSVNHLENFDFNEPATESWSGSIDFSFTAGFLDGTGSWAWSGSEANKDAGAMYWEGVRFTGSWDTQPGAYITASLSQSIGDVFSNGDYIVAGCSLLKSWPGGTSSITHYERIEIQIVGHDAEVGTETILTSQSVTPELIVQTDDMTISNAWRSYGLTTVVDETYDNYQLKLELTTNESYVPGGTKDPIMYDSVLPRMWIDNAYLQKGYSITEVSPKGFFIQRNPSNYIRSDANEFTIQGANLVADTANIGLLNANLIEATTFNGNVNFNSSSYFNGLIQGNVGIGTTSKNSYYTLTIGGSNVIGGLLVKNATPPFSSSIRIEGYFQTASIGLRAPTQTIVPGLTLTTAVFGIWNKQNLGAGIVSIMPQTAPAYRTLFTSGALAEFQNPVIINNDRNSGLYIGPDFGYGNYPSSRTIVTSGSLAEFGNDVTIVSGSNIGIGSGFRGGAGQPDYLLHVSQSSSVAYTSYFEAPSGNYISTAMTGSKMIFCRTSQATQSDLATIPGIQVWNNTEAIGAGSQISLISDSAYAGIVGRRVGIGQQALDFYTENTTRTVKMTVDYDGQVGIGSTAPTEQLDVQGNITCSGDLSCAGTLTKGGGTFRIVNPTPNKSNFLYHSFVESPTAGDNLYRFEIETTTDNEEFVIDLPDYWVHLNENPQVWVSAIDVFSHAYGYVNEKLTKLYVKCEKSGKYNILLIGTRKDPFIMKSWKGVERKI